MNLKNTQKNSCRGDEIKMGKYNIGDKVYLEGKISEHDESDNTYCVDYSDYWKRSQTSCWIKEEVLHTMDDAYNKGLNDAWELARKIVLLERDGGYSTQELKRILGYGGYESVLKAFTPQEALAKVKEYKDKIKVGDVIRLKGNTHEAIVTRANVIDIYYLFRDGSCGRFYAEKDLEKTGHFDSIDEFMRSAD